MTVESMLHFALYLSGFILWILIVTIVNKRGIAKKRLNDDEEVFNSFTGKSNKVKLSDYHEFYLAGIPYTFVIIADWTIKGGSFNLAGVLMWWLALPLLVTAMKKHENW